MTVQLNGLTMAKVPRETEPGYTIDTFAQSTREEFLRSYRKQYPEQRPNADSIKGQSETKFNAPPGHSAHQEHHRNFYQAVRSRKPFFEDSMFGLRTAGPSSVDQHESLGRPRLQMGPSKMVEG